MAGSWVRRNAWWLVVPAVAMCALDFGLTLYGQSAEYRAGGYSKVNELSPSFHYYLSVHPLVFVAAGLVWIATFAAVILLAPERLALVLAIAIVLGHMVGAATWLAFKLHSYQACNVLFLATAVVIVAAFKRGQSADGSAAFDWARTGLPGWVRWVVIAGLVVLPTWWFLVPR